ncbi:ABC transporter ATP-binding protein [Haloglomus halophilum]|uniref:ABC transporter ATP-binding protein n=1 Tax=Haloglomus halophilum TaxID=2962672 RepID=UPI0020C9A385|nr:ABC transporter ATP-binding protein [Haloglomus halophilum]
MPALQLDSVSKRFGDVRALDDVSFTVERGEVYGFLGPNGAGKSTTIDILLDYVRPSAGSVSVFGHDAQAEPTAVHARTGILPDATGLTGHLTARQHVRYAVDSKGSDENPLALLDRVGIALDADRAVGGFSKGMRQRLLLACALVGEPDLLILDEPSTGLDPNGARRMREIVREENERGATVFFSSHILEQVAAVCDRVGILSGGALVASDSLDGLRERVGSVGRLTVTLDTPSEAAVAAVRDLAGVSNVRVDGASVSASCPPDRKAAVVDAARRDGADVVDIRTEEASLEELFAAYTEGEEGEVA